MNIELAQRLGGIGEYYFSKKLREIDELNKAGKPVINLGIGSPDLPPHPDVIKVLQDESAKANTHAYQSYKGVPALREAMSSWYRKWYGVDLDPTSEILPLIGSKEGIMHVSMTYLNPGDEVLIPNPGYPTYKSATLLAGGKCIDYELRGENNWEPDFGHLEDLDLSKVKIMWVNYPHMPTGQVASKELFEKLVAFGLRNNILVCHDNPYSFILNKNPMSLLAVDGAKNVVIELNSLSKSHNMAGWRVGMLAGAENRIDDIIQFKSNMDSGMFQPVQLAAAKALALEDSWFDDLNEIYRRRREKVFQLLDQLEATYDHKQVGLFVWARVPSAYRNGYALSDRILLNARVFITPGGIFGTAGDNYIRISLCSTEEKFDEALGRVKNAI